MKNVKALFIDCDGVLYDKKECTNQDIAIIGLDKTLAQYNISLKEFNQRHEDLRQAGVRGIFNAVLDLCVARGVPFNNFANSMVNNTNYSRISPDPEMLKLLKMTSKILPIYIVTNNSTPHLNKIFACLNNGIFLQDVQKELNIHFFAIESTLSGGIFHSKKMEKQLTNLCTQIGCKPSEVLLLDDTESVRKIAAEQGLQITKKAIENPKETKTILRSVLNERTKTQGSVSLRKTCGGLGD